MGGAKEESLELFLKIGLDEKTAKNTVANNKVTTNLTDVINQAGVADGCSKTIGNLLYTHALYIVYIAAGVFVAGWIEVSCCWILTGERQTAVIRSKYVQVLLNQDMSFFDTYGNNGDIVSQVLSDVLLIQSALSEKVGNYIHNMATFFGGLIIGLIKCWQIALITLATGPFIVAASGISNIFLHRVAENIQDAYAEAARIAEQITNIQGELVVLMGHRRLRITEMHIGEFTYPRLADFGATISGANKSKCQEVLEELDVHERLRLTLELVKKEMEISKIQESIAKAIEEKISGEQRRFLLNEQLKAIKKDL